MLVDKTNFGSVLCNHTNFYRFEETYVVIGQLNEYQFFSAFHWLTSGTHPASQCVTVQWPIPTTLSGPCITAIAGF